MQHHDPHLQNQASTGPSALRMPADVAASPLRQLAYRIGLGVLVVLSIAVVVYAYRDDYRDNRDGELSFLDAAYYASVAVTTTGNGDIVPVDDRGRAITTVFVTAMSVVFLVLLVGTSVELITLATRRHLRERRWRRRVDDHIVICGYGVKGQNALRSLRQQRAAEPESVVVIDGKDEIIEAAVRDGYVGVRGDMSNGAVLQQAEIERAGVVIVAPHRDDTAVLTVLTIRSLNGRARIIAAARELENAPLLRQSGADVVLTSSGSVGNMLGLASMSPHAAMVIEDLLELGRGFDIRERGVEEGEGPTIAELALGDELVVAVYRDGQPVARTPSGSQQVTTGDRLVLLTHT